MPYAMQVESLGGPRQLVRREVEMPVPAAGEVVVETQAIGCNFADVLICEGRYQLKPALPFAPGSELAGVVCAVGSEVEQLRVGDRVMAFVDHGAYATHVRAKVQEVFRLPEQVPFEQAAALGVTYQTAYFALVERAALQAGETLLVHAAAGGAGLAALQLGLALGAQVIGTAGSEEKLELVRAQGATALSYRDAAWQQRVLELSDGRGADVIYESVGGEVFDRSTRCIAFCGRIVIVGFSSKEIPTVQLNRVMLKNIGLLGLHWGAYRSRQPERIQQAMDAIMERYHQGALRPLVHARYPLEEAAQALEALGDRRSVGKVVLLP